VGSGKSSTKSGTKSGPAGRKPGPGPASATKRTSEREASERRRAAEQAGGKKRVSAQQRLAAERQAAAEAREAAERRRKVMTAFVPVLVVLLVVAAFIVAKTLVGSGAKSGKKGTAAAAEVINKISNVPASTFNAVGAGDIKVVPKAVNGPALTSDGKPRVLYVGAEYCPYCAAERWAIAVALSRFGTLHNVGQTNSAPAPEAYPNTSTVAFHGTTLDSPYIAFTPYETATNQVKNGSYTRLDSLTSADEQLFRKYDAPPYVSNDNKGSIPFLLIGGKYLISGASYDAGVLAGKTHAQIAAALKDPNSAISKAVVGTANVITAAICDTTAKKPANVCTSPGVVAAQKKLTSGA
jgi:thiol-disulfide isomerase/thioredoxin